MKKGVKMTALAVTPNTPEWLEERRKHVGASDAPAILGLTPGWRTARDVAKEKLGVVDTGSEENRYCRRGRVLEPLVKKMYSEESGREVLPAPMYRHQEYSWMAATPDGWVAGVEGEVLLECKTASRYMRHEWSECWGEEDEYDVVPLKYWVQVQHQMAVVGQEKVLVAVLFGNEDFFELLAELLESGTPLSRVYLLARNLVEFKVIEVARDEQFIRKLIRLEHDFWSNLEDGILPEDMAYCCDSGSVRVANYEEECLLTDMKTSYLQKLLAEEEFAECSQRVEEAIGADSGLYSELVGKVLYKKGKARVKVNWKSLAENLLAKYVGGAQQEEVKKVYTSYGEIKRRLTFPYKYWRLN